MKTLESVLTSSPVFTVVMYTLPIRPERLSLLEAYGQEHKTPLVAIHSAGFYSYFQINLPGAFPIVDTHPDETATTDLRLLTPWPELTAFAKELTKNIDDLDDFEHGHLPYVVILLHYLEQWKATHDGNYPATYKDKTEFRSMVQRAARTNNPEGGEENFDEAVAAVMRTLVPPSLPPALKEVFEYEHTELVGARFLLQTCISPMLTPAYQRLSRDPGSGSLRTRSRSSTRSTGAYPFRASSPT